jgi:hypothetical protein
MTMSNCVVHQLLTAGLLVMTLASAVAAGEEADRWRTLERQRDAYRSALGAVREEHGGVRSLPAVEFFLFGMGAREKFVYCGGRLTRALNGELVAAWEVIEEQIVPPAYTVAFRTTGGGFVYITEDEEGVWVEEHGAKKPLSLSRVSLPTFADQRHGLVLRVLHQELLVNVVEGRPVPNFFVYAKPWYRDGAMMAMAFEKTNNLHLIRNWVADLREPFDKNNGGEEEADNLGQVLYLISLASDKDHALVPTVRRALTRFEKDGHILGRSDFAEHPVYQTKWAKFGLRSLGLEDPYTVPHVDDGYATLFWWAYMGDDKTDQSVIVSNDYPYLTWAGCHCTGQKLGKLSDRDYPLTWEANASQARYEGMHRVAPVLAQQRICTPHTWHAAEAFLYLLEDQR